MYEQTNTQLGMTPAQYRKGGKGTVISYVATNSLLGRMMLGATDRGLCFLQFGENDAELLRMLRQEYPAPNRTILTCNIGFGTWTPIWPVSRRRSPFRWTYGRPLFSSGCGTT